MSQPLKIVALVGSLRKASYNRALLRAAVAAASASLQIETLEIGDVPVYNSDVQDQGMPAAVTRLAQQVGAADAILIVTPEYNYSIPGVLKNTIDWLSRVSPQPFADKPVGLMGASMGVLGTARAQYHLRQVMVFLDAHVLNKPEVMVGACHTKFDAEGNLTDQGTAEHLARFMASLEALTRRWGRQPA